MIPIAFDPIEENFLINVEQYKEISNGVHEVTSSNNEIVTLQAFCDMKKFSISYARHTAYFNLPRFITKDLEQNTKRLDKLELLIKGE